MADPARVTGAVSRARGGPGPGRRGPAARAGAAGPRRAGAPVRALRPVRGRRAGGAAGRRRAMAGRGAPANPRGWLVTVAARRLMDQARSEHARRRREDRLAAARPRNCSARPRTRPGRDRDDTLGLLFRCCHPALSAPRQIALTLRAVGGLTTAEIAAAFLVPEATMAQRISRAKRRIKATAAARSACPPAPERDERLRAVLHVLYLIFNEGYTASRGRELHRAELSGEAIRLARMAAPAAARRRRGGRAARADAADRCPAAGPDRPDGDLVPLDEQDRGRWDRALIAEGTAWSPPRCRTGSSGPTSCRPPSPRCTTRRPAVDDRLAADPGPVRAAGAARAEPGDHAQPGRRGGRVHGPAAGLDAAGRAGAGPADGRHHRFSPPARTCWSGRRSGRRGGRLPRRRPPRD